MSDLCTADTSDITINGNETEIRGQANIHLILQQVQRDLFYLIWTAISICIPKCKYVPLPFQYPNTNGNKDKLSKGAKQLTNKETDTQTKKLTGGQTDIR